MCTFLSDYDIFHVIRISYVLLFVRRKLDNPGEIWCSLYVAFVSSTMSFLILPVEGATNLNVNILHILALNCSDDP